MTKTFLKEIIQASMTNGNLDEKKVMQIAKHLTRKELKSYINALKNDAAKNSLNITTPKSLPSSVQTEIKEKFARKDISFSTDPELLFGVKITDGDMVYDNSLKSTFNEVISYIKE